MKKYQIQDVDLLVVLYEKLKPWIPNHPNAPLHSHDESAKCITCASEKIQRRGLSHTATSSYQRYQCQDCGKWMRGASIVGRSALREAR